MPLELTVVLRFESSFLIKAGTRKGMTENQKTTTAIKTPMIIFSHFRGSRDRGVVNPIVTATAKITNLVRPAVIQENGGINRSELLNLATNSIAMRMKGIKRPHCQ
jgi:hypothetical protein